jgi:uncharacterized cupin superfamily protein
MTDPVNVGELACEPDASDPPGFRALANRFGPLIGAERLGATIYELPEGQSNCPYHYEYGREEWLFVLEGNPILRDPEGEHRLDPGDVVLFPEGPEGAHRLTNPDPETVRIMILSNTEDPSVGFYPDSGKIGIWPPGAIFRLADEVDYWAAETSPETE